MDSIEAWIAKNPRRVFLMIVLIYVPNVVEPWWSLLVGESIPVLARDLPGLNASIGDLARTLLPTVGMVFLGYVMWVLFRRPMTKAPAMDGSSSTSPERESDHRPVAIDIGEGTGNVIEGNKAYGLELLRASKSTDSTIRDNQTWMPSANVVDAPELIQFVSAWMMPAWNKAIPVLIDIRGRLKNQKPVYEWFFQEAVMEPGGAVYRKVKERLDKKSGTEPLDSLAALMYLRYEGMVAAMVNVSDLLTVPYFGSSLYDEWVEMDTKFMDRLRDFVHHPSFVSSDLAMAAKEMEDGGAGRSRRRTLSELAGH